MIINLKKESVFVFDLDDTLYNEIDYLYSAYEAIAKDIDNKNWKKLSSRMIETYHNGENVFQWLVDTFKKDQPYLNIDYLIQFYREHIPNISLDNDTKLFIELLQSINAKRGLITDGRSISQRNKIKSLGLENFFEKIVISEEIGSTKPSERNYISIENKFPDSHYIYFGDNLKKDFIVPNKRKWTTICILNNGKNIHPQNWLPHDTDYCIRSFNEINVS